MSYVLQIAAVIFGLALIGMFSFNDRNSVKLLLAFSGSYLFSAVIMHFLPELIEAKGTSIGLFVLAGFLVQIILDFISTGLEHGHYHAEGLKKGVLPISAIIGLFLHALFEGLPIDIQHSHESQKTMLIAIVLHKIPITVVLYALLRSLDISGKKMWLIIVLFALMSPLGTVLGKNIVGLAEYSYYLTAFATGIFLHVSTTILFESSHNHRYNFAKLAIVISGMLLAYFTLVIF